MEFLYHYTDKAGLEGILRSQCLWATHYEDLNRLGNQEIEDIKARIQEFLSQNPYSVDRQYFCNYLVEIIDEFFLNKTSVKTDFYITSFSSQENCDYMWNRWGSEFAIAFSRNDIDRLLQKESRFLVGVNGPQEVFYRKKHKLLALKAWENEFQHVLHIEFDDAKARSSLSQRAICLPALYKARHWKQQREWRIILTRPTKNIRQEVLDANNNRMPKVVHKHGNRRYLHLFEDTFSPLCLRDAIQSIIVSPLGDITYAENLRKQHQLKVPIIHAQNKIPAFAGMTFSYEQPY